MFTYSFRQFQTLIKFVAVAASDDDKRPVLQNVLLKSTKTTLTAYAADGFRLHYQTIPSTAGAYEVQLDPAAVAAILKVKLTRKDEPTITLDPKAGTITLDGKPLPGGFDGDSIYPDVTALIPRHVTTQVKVNAPALLAAVKTAAVFAKESNGAVQLHITEAAVLVCGKAEELGESCTQVTPLIVTGIESLAIAFNYKFLLDFLKSAGDSVVTIDLNKSTQPAIFSDPTGRQALVMPLYLDLHTPRRPEDIRTPESYDSTGAYVYERDLYTNRHPDPAAVNGGHVPAYYAPATPAESEPWDHPLTANPEPLPAEVFQSTPEPGACEYDLTTIWAYLDEGDRRSQDVKIAVLHLTNPRPDPAAPIPVDFSIPANRHPLFGGPDSELTIGECRTCTDPTPHALYKGLCLACRQHEAENKRSHR